MKRLVALIVALALMVCTGVTAAEEETVYDPGWGFLRGAANILTAWVELPRALTVEMIRLPVLGIFPGTAKGGAFAFLRLFAGTVDVLALGYGPGLYDETIPEFVWEAPWLPEEEKKE